MKNERPGWDEFYLGVAAAISARGDCRRSKVGAVAVDHTRVIINGGYNGFEPGGQSCLAGDCPRGLKSYDQQPPGGSYTDCDAIHAEDNALRFARQTDQIQRLKGSTMYVTREPCGKCYEQLILWHVARAVWPGGERKL